MWGELACHKRLCNPPPQFSFVCMYVYVCVCVCMCVFGGLSSFYTWMEGLCVVGGGGDIGSFSSSFIASMLYIRFS